jgi:hypothetical protein
VDEEDIMKYAVCIMSLWAFLFCTPSFGADIPKLINYQGMLTDDEGNPLTGSFDLTFYIYDDTTGGDLKWSETQNGVQVQNGLFNMVLGKNSELNLAFDQSYWLAVKVGTEIMPRVRFTSVGYAYRARMADTASVAVAAPSSGGWTDDGSVVRLTTGTDKVGIGTSTPGAELEVFSPDEVDLWLNRGGMGWAAVLSFRRGGGLDWSMLTPSGDTSLLILNQSSQTVQSFLQNGNVGIGKTDPSSKLDVEGDINISTSYKVGGKKVFSAPGTNIFAGYWAGDSTTGYNNTFMGLAAGAYNSSGSGNTYIGEHAATFNRIGDGNTVIGSGASYWNNSGDYNTILGYNAGHNNDTGSYNVFLGNRAGYGETGSNKLYIANSDADPPLIYGDFSTGNVGLGTTNPGRRLHIVGVAPRILIEASSGSPEVNFKNSDDSGTETWALYKHGTADDLRFYQNGDRVTIQNGTGNVGIGTTNPQGYKLFVEGSAAKPGGGSWDNPSDIRLKRANGLYRCGLAEISQLTPIHYNYIEGNDLGLPTEKDYVGLVAQDVQNIIPNAVSENDQGYLMLNSDPIIWAMLNAIKELKAENEVLKKRIERLEAE